MQIISITDTLHEISNPVTWEKNKDISKCYLLTILPRVLSVKLHYQSADSERSPNYDIIYGIPKTRQYQGLFVLTNVWDCFFFFLQKLYFIYLFIAFFFLFYFICIIIFMVKW